MHNPVAMPPPYGYSAKRKLQDNLIWQGMHTQEYRDMINKQTQELLYGREDPGDVMAKQVGGTHYKGATFQPWDIFMQYGLDPWSANVVKYILRFPKKAGKQDLEKAKHYIEYLLANYDKVNEIYYKETA